MPDAHLPSDDDNVRRRDRAVRGELVPLVRRLDHVTVADVPPGSPTIEAFGELDAARGDVFVALSVDLADTLFGSLRTRHGFP